MIESPEHQEWVVVEAPLIISLMLLKMVVSFSVRIWNYTLVVWIFVYLSKSFTQTGFVVTAKVLLVDRSFRSWGQTEKELEVSSNGKRSTERPQVFAEVRQDELGY